MLKILSITAAILCVGCTTFKPPERTVIVPDTPTTYSLYTEKDSGPGPWWRSFGSAELDTLVDTALSGNFDIRTAWARLKQAQASVRNIRSNRLPTATYQVGLDQSRQPVQGDAGDAVQTDSTAYSIGAGASYEVDLWGRLKALRQVEELDMAAAREDLEAAAVTVAAAVVDSWINIMSTRRQIAILEKQIEINRNLLQLQQLRFANGKADALDISQQREALAAAKAKLPLLQLSEKQALNALAVLIGRSGAQNLAVTEQELPDLIPLPATGLPADLLSSRPDIRAAGLRLTSADWQVSAARADRLPNLTLSANALFSTDSVGLLFNNWIASLAAGLTGPLFDAGARSAEVERSRAMAEEYVAGYARTVAQAIQEVEDSLATEQHQTEYIALLNDQLKASQSALKDAQIQYANGQDNYLNYLTAWTSIQDLERQLVSEQGRLD